MVAGDAGLRIGVLGPLLGTRNGIEVRLPRGRAGVFLAVLAISGGHPVGSSRLAELIWSEDQPVRIRASLQTLAARVRAAVPGVVVTVGDGYLLDIDPDHIDLLCFRHLVRSADQADDDAAAFDLLDQALGLWRGEPLSDLGSPALDQKVLPGLADERLAAVQQRAELNLAAGRHDRVIAELCDLTGQYPLREPLWGQLLRALARAGRPAEAIREYHRAREILATELGVDPSPDLQDLYQQLLHADRRVIGRELPVHDNGLFSPRAGQPSAASVIAPPARTRTEWAPSVPRQLPAGAAGFTGRAGPLKLLLELADTAVADGEEPVISAITGMAGVGKTALALHWAHRAAVQFSDGQLYADLRGFGPSGDPASPAEVIRGFLDALGVSAARIPADLEAQAALYRSSLAGRQIMIVLDNARDASQVRPLLPGSPGCMAVVTSRTPLTSLAAGHGARLISLDILTDGEATDLLAARLGRERVTVDPDTTAELVSLCGRLPLALAITAARADARPHLPLAICAAELRDARQRLDALDGGDPDSNLRAVFSWSCQDLSDEAASLFQLLGIHPGPDVSVTATASLAGTELAQTRTSLRQLVSLNLVTEHRPGRYSLHDLLRAYATDQATAALSASCRANAIGRMLDHYLHTAHDAGARLSPQHYPLPLSPAKDRTHVESFAGTQQALDWFDSEYKVLLAVTALAASSGFDSHSWQIPAALARYLDWRGYWQDWAEMQDIALAAARRLGDKNARACVLRASGLLHLRLASYDQARSHFSEALQLYRDLDDTVGKARAHGDLSMTFAIQDRYREALAHSERALELARSARHPHVHALMLNKVGWHAAHLGDYQRALACCQQAMSMLQSLGHPFTQAFVWDSLGYIHQHLRHHAEAVDCYQRAVTLFREIGNRFELAATLIGLGDACHADGQPAAAYEAWQQALPILTSLHHPDAIQLQAKLDRGVVGPAGRAQEAGTLLNSLT